MERTYRFQTRVAYGDLDQQFRLTLPAAMAMMQEAAILHSAGSGYSIFDIPRTHVIWMLVQWRVRLVGQAQWNDQLEVETWPRSISRVTSSRNFVLRNKAGETIAVAESNWILVSTDTGRATKVTPEIAAAYDLVERDVFADPVPVVPEGEGQEVCDFRVSFRDIDTNHHVNNLVYLDYARQALPEKLREKPFQEVSVRYSRQFLLGDHVRCFYRADETCHAVDLRDDNGTVHATVIFS